jgi:hypothetical protein
METRPAVIAHLQDQVEATLNDSPDRPICVHGLLETLKESEGGAPRDEVMELVRTAAENLVREGQAHHAFVSAIAVGAHCEDEVFWTSRSPHQQLEEFGPEFEQFAVARRLASHFVCHGL